MPYEDTTNPDSQNVEANHAKFRDDIAALLNPRLQRNFLDNLEDILISTEIDNIEFADTIVAKMNEYEDLRNAETEENKKSKHAEKILMLDRALRMINLYEKGNFETIKDVWETGLTTTETSFKENTGKHFVHGFGQGNTEENLRGGFSFVSDEQRANSETNRGHDLNDNGKKTIQYAYSYLKDLTEKGPTYEKVNEVLLIFPAQEYTGPQSSKDSLYQEFAGEQLPNNLQKNYGEEKAWHILYHSDTAGEPSTYKHIAPDTRPGNVIKMDIVIPKSIAMELQIKIVQGEFTKDEIREMITEMFHQKYQIPLMDVYADTHNLKEENDPASLEPNYDEWDGEGERMLCKVFDKNVHTWDVDILDPNEGQTVELQNK